MTATMKWMVVGLLAAALLVGVWFSVIAPAHSGTPSIQDRPQVAVLPLRSFYMRQGWTQSQR
jgi:hypothetical protein